MMNYEWRKAIDAMRRDGYAVCVITPEELREVPASQIEGYLTAHAKEEIMLQESYAKNRLKLLGEDDGNT